MKCKTSFRIGSGSAWVT